MEKTCKDCGQVKPIAEFYKQPSNADGHRNECKSCWYKRVKENVKANPDHYRKYNREYANLPHRVQAIAKYMKTPSGKKAHDKASSNWEMKNPKRMTAIQVLNNAMRYGKIERYPCWICGATKVHGHHPDYDQPLDVVWLCPKHHKQAHELSPFINS